MSTPTRLVLVRFKDGTVSRCFKQTYRKPLLPGEPTDFVVRAGRQVWVRPGQHAWVEA